MDRVESYRHFFAELITANAGIRTPDSPLKAAFAATPRERLAGPGPWKVDRIRQVVLNNPGGPRCGEHSAGDSRRGADYFGM